MNWRRWLRRFTDSLILLLVGWLLLAAAYVSLGRQFVPAVADYQQQLVAWVEQQTGRAIDLQSLQGQMQGAQPVFTLRGLRVHEGPDRDSPVLLDLAHVTARVDVFASLWQRQPVMDALQLEGLALEMLQDEAGQWRLAGLGPQEASAGGLDRALELLFEQRRITLLDTSIRISPWAQPEWVFSEGHLTLLNRGHWHRLDAMLRLPDNQQVSVQVKGSLPGRDWHKADVDFFAALPVSDWSDWLTDELLSKAHLQQVIGGGELWGSWRDNRLQRLSGSLTAPTLTLQLPRSAAALEELQLRFALELSAQQQALNIDNFSLRQGDQHWPATRLQLRREVHSGEWQVRADYLPLELLGSWLPALVTNDYLAGVFTTLAPEGSLEDVLLIGGALENFADWSLQARLHKVGVQAWEAVPAIAGISGVAWGTPASGSLLVNSENWSMHLPELFAQRWNYTGLSGQLDWSWADLDGLRLAVPGAAVQGEEGQAAAALQLHIPRPGGTPTMDLRVALHDSRAEFHDRYLPTRTPAMSAELTQWLHATQLTGAVPLVIFGYQGSLLHDATADERQISLYGRLEQGSLFFQPGWPALQQVSGSLWLHNTELQISQAQARLLQTQLDEVTVSLDHQHLDDAFDLHVNGRFAGPLEDGLQLMQQTPLAALTGDPLHGWTGTGQLQGALQLVVPLDREQTPALQLGLQAQAQQLHITQIDATVQELKGQISYEHGKGLTSDTIQLRFMGQPVTGHLDVQGAEQRLSMSGTHDLQNLLKWPLLAAVPPQLAEGSIQWDAQLWLGDKAQRLQLNSDLRGLQLNLPAPLGKTAQARLPSRLQLNLGAQSRWQFQLGTDLQGLLTERQGALDGDIRYRWGAPQGPVAQGISVSARLPQLDLQQWQQWYASSGLAARQSTSGATAVGQSAGPQRLAMLRALQLEVGHFTGLGLELQDLALSGQQLEQGWELRSDHAELSGRVYLPSAAGTPISLELQRLHFPQSDTSAASSDALIEPLLQSDPLQDIDPASLPAMDISISELSWGKDVVGATRFKLRPVSTGLDINELDLALRGGLQLNGTMHWGTQRTQFEGKLAAKDIGEVLRAWRYAPSLTSKAFTGDVNLEWPGSPAWFAIKRASGSVALEARNGMLQSGDSSAEALRVFGLLNFNSLARRLRLDFSDLFGRGTAYDTLHAEAALINGLIQTMNPWVAEGPTAKLQLEGSVDLPADRVDMGLLVTLPLSNNLPLAAIIAGAPQIGGVLYLFDKLWGDKVARLASVKYRISGKWTQPSVDFDRAFDNKAKLED